MNIYQSIRFTFFFMLTLLLSLPLSAQRHSSHQGSLAKVDQFQEELQLTEEQKDQLQVLKQDLRKELKAMRQSGEQVNRGSRKALFDQHKSKVKAVLTAEQITKLETIQEERREKMKARKEAVVQVRKELKATKQKVKELYPGNPGRATDKPTTGLILGAFKNIHLNIVSVENKIYVKVSELKPIQLKLLELLKIPPEIYTGMEQLSFSHLDFSEM